MFNENGWNSWVKDEKTSVLGILWELFQIPFSLKTDDCRRMVAGAHMHFPGNTFSQAVSIGTIPTSWLNSEEKWNLW